jgi:hypothetical protein
MMWSICEQGLAFQIFNRISVGKKGNNGKVPATPRAMSSRSTTAVGAVTVENGGRVVADVASTWGKVANGKDKSRRHFGGSVGR